MAVPGVEPAETWARTLAAAAVLGGDAAALGRIGGYAGERARALLAAWQDQPREMRARVVARTVAEVRAPIPANAGRVHRDWIRFEDARAREAWETRRGDPVGVWYQRRITAWWVGLPTSGSIEGAEDIRDVGLAAIARVAMTAGDVGVAQIAASLSPEDGASLIEHVRRQPQVANATARDVALVKVHGGDPLKIGAVLIRDTLLGERAIQARMVAGPEVARLLDEAGG
jgi:hypothetical protein